mgnify:CR=1 FL=1
MKKIYADNAATTHLSKEALDAMMPYLTDYYGNPSSLYSLVRLSRMLVILLQSALMPTLKKSSSFQVEVKLITGLSKVLLISELKKVKNIS